MKELLRFAALAVCMIGLLAGCTDLGVGRKCVDPLDAGASGTLLISPALECISRLCLIQPQTMGDPERTTCTATCDTDEDCAKATSSTTDKSLCNTNFVCAIATSTTAFRCKKVCICRSDLVAGVNQDPVDGGVQVPSTCCAEGTSGPNCPIRK